MLHIDDIWRNRLVVLRFFDRLDCSMLGTIVAVLRIYKDWVRHRHVASAVVFEWWEILLRLLLGLIEGGHFGRAGSCDQAMTSAWSDLIKLTSVLEVVPDVLCASALL